jgi:hypothetical protein
MEFLLLAGELERGGDTFSFEDGANDLFLSDEAAGATCRAERADRLFVFTRFGLYEMFREPVSPHNGFRHDALEHHLQGNASRMESLLHTYRSIDAPSNATKTTLRGGSCQPENQ